MSTAEIEEVIRALTPAELARVRALVNSLPDALDAPAYRTHERERAWIERHRDEYLDQCVALDGDRLLAHGADARAVYLAAQAAGVEAPYIDRITLRQEDAFMGGWL